MADDDPRARLVQLAVDRGVSLSELSRLIGRNPSYLQQFVRKGSPRKLEETDRATLARFFGVAEAQLGAPEEKSPAMAGREPRGGWIAIPRLPLGASAGPGAFADGEEPFGAFGATAPWLRRNNLDPARLSAIAVVGDSMEPTLRDGDEIIVDRTPGPRRDGIHVVRVDGALLVKRLEMGRPGVVVLKSDNRIYDPIELSLSEVEIIGRVVWKSGRL